MQKRGRFFPSGKGIPTACIVLTSLYSWEKIRPLFRQCRYRFIRLSRKAMADRAMLSAASRQAFDGP